MIPFHSEIGAADHCTLCRLYHTDERYRTIIDRQIAAVAETDLKRSPCLHLRITDKIRLELCAPCAASRGGASVKVAVVGCDIHGECTPLKKIDGVQCCAGCDDRS